MKVTKKMIAQAAGVSPATVTRYYNGSAVLGEETAKRIQKAIRECGAADLDPGTHRQVIMILVTQFRLPFFRQGVDELMKAGTKHYTFVLFYYNPQSPAALNLFLEKMHPIGAVYFEEEMDVKVLDELQRQGIRTVLFGGYIAGHRTDMVHVNDIVAAYEGTRYLLGLGHREILFLSDEVEKISPGFQRVTGSRQALTEAGLPIDPEMVCFGDVTFDAGYRETMEAIRLKKKFTAIFAFSDDLAIGAMAALYDSGIRVPEDVSVLGYDDLEIARRVRPALSTIHQPLDGFGQKVIELFERPAGGGKEEVLLSHEIVERESCRRIGQLPEKKE